MTNDRTNALQALIWSWVALMNLTAFGALAVVGTNWLAMPGVLFGLSASASAWYTSRLFSP